MRILPTHSSSELIVEALKCRILPVNLDIDLAENCRVNRLRKLSLFSTLAIACLIPLGLNAVINLPVGSAGVHEWLPEFREERKIYDEFVAAFGNDQIALVSWDDCRIDDPRLIDFRHRLEEEIRLETNSLFASVISTDQLVSSLVDEPLRLDPEEACRRWEGFMIGRDRTAALVIGVTERGAREQSAVMDRIYSVADKVNGLGRDSLRAVGTVFEGYAVDKFAEESLQLVPFSGVLGLLIAWLCLKKIRYALTALTLGGLGQVAAVAVVYYCGYHFSAVLIVLPTLVFMLTLSGAIHLMNYYLDSLTVDPDNAATLAVLIGWKPCVLSSLTTVLGMGSLWTSQLKPVREFGLFSGASLTVATIILLALFPTIVPWMDRWFSKGRRIESRKPSDEQPEGTWRIRYIGFLSTNTVSISVASMAILLLGCWGLSKLRASTKFTDMFPAASRVNQDMLWFERHLGPIASVEVVLKFPKDSPLDTFDRVRRVQRFHEALPVVPEVGAVLSPITFLPSWSEGSSIGAVARRSAVRKALDSNRDQLRDHHWIADEADGEHWRIVAKISATSSTDYGTTTEAIRKTCSQVAHVDGEQGRYSFYCTGLIPIIHQTQVTLLLDLGYSFLTAFLLITPIMIWVTRSFRGGLLAMIPNVLPIAVVFGVMGWFGLSLDIAGILTASVALGIAIDDTLHFLCWYMNSRRQLDRAAAVDATYKACSAAMLHTTLISCLSMAPFLFAPFLPTQQFAKLMIAMLTFAIVGDLFFLPALLLSPWGKLVRSH
jgi:predicted RND superfamily exporter protein